MTTSTTVNVLAYDVHVICTLGMMSIEEQRKEELESAIRNLLKEETSFLWQLFGRKYKYPTRWDALDYLKEPLSGYFSHSRYEFITKQGSGYYQRLSKLKNMALSSIDGVVCLNMEDHSLLRRYAERNLK